MVIKFLTFATLAVLVRAGAPVGYAAAPIGHYSPAPAVSYATYAAPTKVAAPVAYAAPVAKVAYAPAPIAATYTHSAPVSYAHPAPVATYAHATPVAYAQPAYGHSAPVLAKTIIAEAPVEYDFGYSVNDPHTGDSKSQTESRRGDSVHGSYSLIDADGTRRTVEYTADDHNGFNAVVHREPLAVKAVAKVVAPVAYAAPAKVAYAPAPVTYAHSAPVSYASAPVQYAPAPVHYASAPVQYASAPVAYAHQAAPVAYAAPLATKVAYSQAPSVSYTSYAPAIAKVAAPAAYASPAYYHH